MQEETSESAARKIINVAFRFTSTNKGYKLRRVAPPGFATFYFRKAPVKRLIAPTR